MAQAQLEGGKAGMNVAQDAATMWTEGFKQVLNVREELADKIKQSNEWWVERWQSEAALTSKLASNIGASRSFPEAVAAWQQWASRRFEMMAEDRQHMMDDYQALAKMSTRVFSNGFSALRGSA